MKIHEIKLKNTKLRSLIIQLLTHNMPLCKSEIKIHAIKVKKQLM